ncbi:FeoB-associated Cys-rich membrane protein [Campylobacter sp. 1BO]
MSLYETLGLVAIGLAAAYFVYVKEFKQKDCGCGSGKNCHSKTKQYK